MMFNRLMGVKIIYNSGGCAIIKVTEKGDRYEQIYRCIYM